MLTPAFAGCQCPVWIPVTGSFQRELDVAQHLVTLAGDLVQDLPFDGTVPADMQFGVDPVTAGQGAVPWNLISRNGQSIVSGIYLYSVDTELGRQVGKFVIIR